ncbi:ribonuclease R [Deferribacter autotrophicus]|uniref:Ribonuclease R n=1 Tax=Deferribacter autotrophicus TaxID=500465 RepID=A0A5A8F2F9_9BACT|nr:ribonuclease R [Deferribacter autotrophicus]
MDEITKKEIIELLKQSSKPLNFNQILYLSGIEKKVLRKTLRTLIIEGKIIKFKNGKYAPCEVLDLVIGTVDGHPDGYAFLIPEDKELEDVFIPPKKLNGAVHGDKVTARIVEFRGKKEAHVIKVIERGFKRVVGRIEKSKYFAYVIPYEKKFFYDIYIPNKYAKKLKDDDVVICEIIKYPEKGKNPEGKIKKVLGNLYDKGIENKIVLAKYDLRINFPKSVKKEVKETADFYFKNAGERTDFTRLFTVTIDGEDARDFDDAISIEKTNGGYILYVHIADVAHYVRPGTNIDKEAYNRATSVYFPEFAIPMLPEKLSNEQCSLMPNVERLAMTVKIEYDKVGNRKKTSFYQSIIKSDYRLTYNYVNDLIDGKEETDDENLKYLVDVSKELTDKLIKKRKRIGMIDFDLPEATFIFDDDGNLIDIVPFERKFSHRIIENFMIEANEAVAEYLEEHIDISVFRVHDYPDAKKVKEFNKMCQFFGIDVLMPDEITPEMIQKIAEKVKESKYGYVLGSMLVRTMQKALYSIDNIGHFGLASESYTHFTSPIRRYPDLLVHRILKTLLFRYDYKINKEYLGKAADHCSNMEQNAESAEREIHQYKKLKFLLENRDKVYDAFINRISSNGFFIFIEKLLLTGFVHISSLDNDYYVVDIETNTIFGKASGKKYRVGDFVKVKVDKVNFDYLEADFILVE